MALRWASYWLARYVENGEFKRRRLEWRREVVVITGGAGGLGQAIIEQLLLKCPGVRIASLDLAPAPAHSNPSVVYYQTNILDEADIARAAKDIREKWGEPSVIINNAGILRSKELLELTGKEFDLTLKVNVLGSFLVIKEFLPAIAKRNHGHIVQVASTAGWLTVPGMVDYAVSKAGAVAFHEGLSAELKYRYNAPQVRTSCICPLKIDTPLGSIVADHKGATMPAKLTPQGVAKIIVDQLNSGLSGNMVFVPGNLSATLPLIRYFPAYFRALFYRASALNDFSTKNTRETGLKSGYKILVDDL
ncbi:NAD(P)-binding protein [Atractiella rhizophila]|nr:NAD(P)-binding protein [Atractiella rhizophila]